MTDTDPTAIERTVVFIDLAGFTVATAAHGDETAADLAERLGELTTTSLGDGDQLVGHRRRRHAGLQQLA